MRDVMRERLAATLHDFINAVPYADAASVADAILDAARAVIEERLMLEIARARTDAKIIVALDQRVDRHEQRLDADYHFASALEQRVAVLEQRHADMREFVAGYINARAQDHGGTEAAERHAPLSGQPVRRQPAEKIEPPDGAASVQPSPAPADHARAAILRWRALAQGRAPAVTAAFQSCADELEAALPAIARAEVERFAAWWERQRDEDLGHNNCTICERVRDPKAMVARYFAEQEAKDG